MKRVVVEARAPGPKLPFLQSDPLLRLWIAAAALVLLAMASAAWPSLKAHLQALAILKRVSSQSVPFIAGEAATDAVRTEDVSFVSPSGLVHARLYLPVGHPRAQSIVILHGVQHLGMDEPRLMAFATSIAACGLRVLTPELPDIADYRIDQSSIRTIGEAAKWFAAKTGAPVGLMGLSFSGGMALIAATEPRYAGSIKYVFAVGAQDQMARVVRFYQTGQDIRPDHSIERLSPHEYGSLVLEYEYLEDFVSNPADLEPIRSVLRAHLYEDNHAEQQAMVALNAHQRAQVEQILDTSSEWTKAALKISETKHLRELNAMSPHGKIAALQTPVFLLHGEADNVIPSAESQWLAAELPRRTLKSLLISPEISHVDRSHSRALDLWDQWQLVHFVALVMEEAERR